MSDKDKIKCPDCGREAEKNEEFGDNSYECKHCVSVFTKKYAQTMKQMKLDILKKSIEISNNLVYESFKDEIPEEELNKILEEESEKEINNFLSRYE